MILSNEILVLDIDQYTKQFRNIRVRITTLIEWRLF
jgi:hypothetical protein